METRISKGYKSEKKPTNQPGATAVARSYKSSHLCDNDLSRPDIIWVATRHTSIQQSLFNIALSPSSFAHRILYFITMGWDTKSRS